MRFEKMKWKELEEEAKKNTVLVLPIGSVEQHGYHLPVDTDIDCAWYISKKVTEKTKTLLLPPIYYGYVEYALDFPGTVSVSTITFINYIVEIATSLWKTGFRKMVVINGHGGNAGLLAASFIVSEKTNMLFAVLDYYSMIADIFNKERDTKIGDGGHAAELETDIKYFIDPENVDPSKALAEMGGGPNTKYTYFDLGTPAPVTLLVKWKHFSKSGVYGDATKSTAEKGKKWVNDSIVRIVEFIEIFKKIPIPED
ncbi:MAG: creatininase family protein [Actinobacteria bacterium]|nr:creatininase family protein [Actinomycetota bacterium]